VEAFFEQLAGSNSLLIYSVAIAFLLACGFGFPLPEDVILLTLGYFSFLGDVHLATSIGVALFGVLAGDSAVFWIGRIYGERVLRIAGIRRVFKPHRIQRVREAFDHNGLVYLFVARFMPGLRAVTFWSAGLFGLRYRTFLLLDGVAALISVPLLTYIGFLLGEAFHDHLDDVRDWGLVLGAVGLVIAAIVTWRSVRRLRARRRARSVGQKGKQVEQ